MLQPRAVLGDGLDEETELGEEIPKNKVMCSALKAPTVVQGNMQCSAQEQLVLGVGFP